MQNCAYDKKQPDEPVIGAGLRRAPPQILRTYYTTHLSCYKRKVFKVIK